jgi:hypothetical protein
MNSTFLFIFKKKKEKKSESESKNERYASNSKTNIKNIERAKGMRCK